MDVEKPLFSLGRVVVASAALEAVVKAKLAPHDLVIRHASGDWGDRSDEGMERNDRAVLDGERITSAYKVGEDVRIFVSTERDRSATTLFLADEY